MPERSAALSNRWVVTGLSDGTVLDGLVAVVASWLTRQPSDVEVEIDGRRFRGRVTRAQRDELVAAYVRRLDRDS